MSGGSRETRAVTCQKSRNGTAEDRGKIARWPEEIRVRRKGFFGHLVRLVPGVVTGAANVDPSLIITATVAGAAFGYSLLWVVVLCIPFLETIFGVSARLGYETRQGLVDLLRQTY